MTALRWAIPALVVAACVGYLIYSATGGSAEYYLTVGELRSHATGGDVRVAGVVQDDVRRSDGGLHVTFTEKDRTASVPVEYAGSLPDIFKPGHARLRRGFMETETIGIVNPSRRGIFVHGRRTSLDHLACKCPSAAYRGVPVSRFPVKYRS